MIWHHCEDDSSELEPRRDWFMIRLPPGSKGFYSYSLLLSNIKLLRISNCS